MRPIVELRRWVASLVDQSKSVIVLKGSMNSGFAGIDNPLFVAEGTSMLFGDAKKSASEVTGELKAL